MRTRDRSAGNYDTGPSGSSESPGRVTATDASDRDVSEDSELERVTTACDTIEHSDMSELEGKLATLAVEGTMLAVEGTW